MDQFNKFTGVKIAAMGFLIGAIGALLFFLDMKGFAYGTFIIGFVILLVGIVLNFIILVANGCTKTQSNKTRN